MVFKAKIVFFSILFVIMILLNGNFTFFCRQRRRASCSTSKEEKDSSSRHCKCQSFFEPTHTLQIEKKKLFTQPHLCKKKNI